MLLQLMSKELSIDTEFLLKIANKNDAYKKYKINKKRGGKRTIYHPSKKLKLLQYWLVKRVFSKFPISEYSTGYSKGNSIKKNALIHKNSNYILHMDITNFFENITQNHINNLLMKIKDISSDEIEFIKKIILFNGEHLVIGSVASPIVSNCIMYDIDNEIFDKCIKGKGLRYTRYADDIIISSKSFISEDIIDEIDCILKKNMFEINRKKTYFMNKKNRRAITGIVIDNNNNSLSIGNKKYRELKRIIYEFLVKNNGDRDKILGYLSYIQDINYEKYQSLKQTYCKYDKNKILFRE